MANKILCDGDEFLLFQSPDVAYQTYNGVDSPDFFDLSNTDTQSGTYLSKSSTNSSPSQSIPYSPNLSMDDFGFNFTENETIDVSSMAEPTDKIHIIAQPKALYRERYCSETDPNKHRAQRFIRADDGTNKHEYPTVQIPSKWRDLNRDLYIRITMVTIFSDKVPVVCVHPYPIDTQEADVLRDPQKNSLYFPITREEIFSGLRSFRISRKKMIQHDLKSYGPLRLFDLNENDIQRVANSHDAKQIIETYQLWKSQLVFTIAEGTNNNQLPVPIPYTSVTSQIMSDEASTRRKSSVNNTNFANIFDEDTIKCTPRKGEWNGGDEILMVIPKLDRRKVFNIYFDYGSMGQLNDIRISFVDSKTICFQTPPCPMLIAEQNLTVPLIVTQNDLIIARIDFVYLTPMKTSVSLCSRCQFDMANNSFMSNKRRFFMLDPTVSDGGGSLIQQMSQLTTGEKSIELNQPITNNDANSKFDKYLGQLQEAMVEFVRTNNPSQLFRRTRLLLSKCDDNPPPLDDAIQRGHIDLALRLIEQVVDMPVSNGLLQRENNDGETPLLLAAKLNHWNLIEIILKKRLDLTEQIDKYGNNMLHLLANISDHKADETIKNVLRLLSNDIITNLLNKKNKNNKTPIEIAQTKINNQSADLFDKS